MKKEITMTTLTNGLITIRLKDITPTLALAYANANKIVRINGIAEKFLCLSTNSCKRFINAIYNSGILYNDELLEFANYYIEATDPNLFIRCVEEKGEQWCDNIYITTCKSLALHNIPYEMERYSDCIDLERFGEKLALEEGLYVTEDKHIVKIY